MQHQASTSDMEDSCLVWHILLKKTSIKTLTLSSADFQEGETLLILFCQREKDMPHKQKT